MQLLVNKLVCNRRGLATKVRVLAILAAFSSILSSEIASGQSRQPSTVQLFLNARCLDCHNGDSLEGGLDLTDLSKPLADAKFYSTAVKIFDRVSTGEMPPASNAQPPQQEKIRFLELLSKGIIAEDERQQTSSGRTLLRRLNRTEYENTVRDLLGVKVDVRDILPPDSISHGFDTVADGLRFSQLQIEKYLEAASVAVEAATELTEEPERFNQRMSLKDEKAIRENLDTAEGTIKDPVSGEKHRVLFRELPEAVVMFSTGYPPGDFRQFNAPVSGLYRIRASAYSYQCGDGQAATLRLFAHRFREKRLLGFFEMPDQAREVEVTVHLERNELVQILPYGIGFDEDGKGIWNVGAEQFRGSGLAVQWLEIEGPLGQWPPASVARLFPDVPLKEIPKNQRRWRPQGTLAWELNPDDPRAAAERVITSFASRAFRRPLEQNEAKPFIQLAWSSLEAGSSFEQAAQVGLRAVLTSPQFLFLDERVGRLDDYAIASRLSYFLWSGPPDAELLQLAAEGKLSQTATLREQTERLLNSPRSAQFVSNFTGQWLDIRNIKATSPDKQLYPEFDEMLELSMVQEIEAFFAELLAKDLSVANLIDSDFVMLNSTMAKHYGIAGVSGENFRPVKLPSGSPRGGVLTQAAVLKVTANGTVTSPVLRGAWVMKRLLGKPPQPPPPNVGSVEPDTRGASTIREELAKHRDSETCARCHSQMDPPGFALESFDVIGGWRDRYRSLGQGDQPPWKLDGQGIWQYKLGPSVDASGELADGRTFKDISEFKQLIMNDQDQVLRTLAERLVTYSTGAGIRFSDRSEVERIATEVAGNGSGLRSLVHQVVQSKLFHSK